MSEELVKPETSFMDLVIPKDVKTGMENCDMSDLPIPRLKIMNGLSNEITERKPGINIGDVLNSASGKIYPQGTEFVFLSVTNGAIFSKGKKLICRSDDGVKSFNGAPCSDCPHGVSYLIRSNIKPWCNATKDFILVERSSLSKNFPDVLAMSFKVSSMSIANNMLNQIKQFSKDHNKIFPLYSFAYKLTTVVKSSDQGDFTNPVLTLNGTVKQEEFNRLSLLSEEFSLTRKVKEEDADLGF